MVPLLFYVFIYCNADIILNNLYLANYSTNNELISENNNFYYSIKKLNLFVLFVYSLYVCKNVIYYNSINKTSNALALVYIKYTLNSLLTENMTIEQHEFSRNIMWLFATPLMLKMYCDVNNIQLQDINIHYHIIPVTINIFIYNQKNTPFFYGAIGFSWLLLTKFIKTLIEKRDLTFTNIFLFIWFIFMSLNTIDVLQLVDRYSLSLYYSFADVIGKMITCIIVSDYNEKEIAQLQKMDLQSVQFVSYMLQHIKKYQLENKVITQQCVFLLIL